MTYFQAVEKIREKLKSVKSDSFQFDFAIQVNLINKDCSGTLYIANLDGNFAVEPYDYRDNNANVTLMLGDLTKLFEGKLNVEKAVESGKIKVTGDINALMQLFKLVESEVKVKTVKKAKPAVKKTKK